MAQLGGGGKQRYHTMNPHIAEMLKKRGMDEIYMKMKQLDEAAALVEEGKLKREVYDALVENVEQSLNTLESSTRKKKEKSIFSEVMASLRPAKEARQDAELSSKVLKGEKPILESFLFKKGQNGLWGSKWKKRYCVLYPRFLLILKHKGDRHAKETVILTAEFFVSQSSGQQARSSAHLNNDDESESVATEETAKAKKDMDHAFLLSDLECKHTFAATSLDECTLWMHTLKTTLRKIMEEEDYFDTPRIIGAPERGPEEIQADFERRKQNYLQSQKKKTLEKKPKGFFRKKPSEREIRELEAKLEEESDELAKIAISRQLLEQERENVRRLEEEQQDRESEVLRLQEQAESWRQRYEEAEGRAERAVHHERELEKELELIKQMRAHNIEKEEAIKAEHETTSQQLESIKAKRRMSRHPADMQQYEDQIAKLQAKLDALTSALQVDINGLDWDGTLQDAEEKMKLCIPRLMSDNPSESMDAQAEFDQWDKIVRNHADYRKREENKWKDWQVENEAPNNRALEEMRAIVPREVITGVSENFLKQRGLKPGAAKRVMATKIFQFLWMSKEEIAKVHIADLNSRYVTLGLDIVELRAVYACLPDEFQNDHDGSKKNWLVSVRTKLFQMTEKEKNGQLTKSEERNGAYRSGADAAPSPAKSGAKPAQKKNKKPAVAKKLDTSKLDALFSGGGGGGGPKKGPAPPGFPGAGGPPPHVLAMMKRGAGEDPDQGGAPTAKPSRKSITRSIRGAIASVKSVLGGSSNPAEEGSNPAAQSRPKSRKGKQSMSEGQKAFSKEVRGMMDSVKENFSVDVDDFDEKNAPAFDFGGDYSGSSRKATLSRQRAGEFSKGIEDGIENLCNIIKEKGAFDRSEGGVATMTFGQLFEEYESISDMLVGLLMRAKKRKRVKYMGDMLFQGIHDGVKITLLH